MQVRYQNIISQNREDKPKPVQQGEQTTTQVQEVTSQKATICTTQNKNAWFHWIKATLKEQYPEKRP